jgi:hypothetical protein
MSAAVRELPHDPAQRCCSSFRGSSRAVSLGLGDPCPRRDSARAALATARHGTGTATSPRS